MQCIKKNRSGIDAIINGIKKEVNSSREVSLSLTCLQKAQMFLGLVLNDLGSENPYPNSMNAINPDIEARADQAVEEIEIPKEIDQTATSMVKFFRGVIQDYANGLENKIPKYSTRHFITAIDALCEAKMWLGQELNNIRLREEIKS